MYSTFAFPGTQFDDIDDADEERFDDGCYTTWPYYTRNVIRPNLNTEAEVMYSLCPTCKEEYVLDGYYCSGANWKFYLSRLQSLNYFTVDLERIVHVKEVIIVIHSKHWFVNIDIHIGNSADWTNNPICYTVSENPLISFENYAYIMPNSSNCMGRFLSFVSLTTNYLGFTEIQVIEY